MWITLQDDKGTILDQFESSITDIRLVKERLITSKRNGGLKGGLVTAARMTPEQRKERAMKGVQARQAKRAANKAAKQNLSSIRYQTISSSGTI